VLLVALAAAINMLLGAHRVLSTQVSQWVDFLPRFVFVFLFVGLGEETGWRGFALPELQKSYSPLVASLVIAVFWAAWHIPLMGVEFKGAVIPAFLLSVVAGSVVLTWLRPPAEAILTACPSLCTMHLIEVGEGEDAVGLCRLL